MIRVRVRVTTRDRFLGLTWLRAVQGILIDAHTPMRMHTRPGPCTHAQDHACARECLCARFTAAVDKRTPKP